MSNSSDFQTRNSRFGGHASLAVAHQQYFVNTNGNGGLETPNQIMWRAANAEAASMLSNWTNQLLLSNHNAFSTYPMSGTRVGELASMDHARAAAPPSEGRWGFSGLSLVVGLTTNDAATTSTNGKHRR